MENQQRCCKVCKAPIPEGRLKVYPETDTCTAHSSTSKFISNIIQHGDYEGDGYQEIEIIRDPEAARKLSEYDGKTNKRL